MVGDPRNLEELERKGFDLLLRCRGCKRRRLWTIEKALRLFRKRGWNTDWRSAHRRFRCPACDCHDVQLLPSLRIEQAPSYAVALRRQQWKPRLVEETLRPGLRPPPPGVSITAWNRATEAERKRMVERSRN